MGFSPYLTPDDAGVLGAFLISMSIVKEIVRFILHGFGIRIASWENHSLENTMDTIECDGNPSESYIEEFRSRTPAILYGSIYSSNGQLHECSVCLAEFGPKAEINHLSCGHIFHKLCLEKWLKYRNVTCPLCRNNMLPQDEENISPM